MDVLARDRASHEPNARDLHLSSFVGRSQELKDIDDLMARERLVTLAGPGGVGKTRLAFRAAADAAAATADAPTAFPDGVTIVDLAPVHQDELVQTALARALGMLEQPGRTLDDAIADRLADAKALLVIDNCEHVLDAARALVQNLLRVAPNLRVLATSREPLGISGERLYLVPPLAHPIPQELGRLDTLQRYEAIQLFVDRARSASPSFTLTERNAHIVARICHRLDGIPLAIELAAARASILGVQQIEQRLDDRFALLARGGVSAQPRQQTLYALVDWSYRLLGSLEAAALRRAAVFTGSFDIDDAEAVIDGDGVE
ncbi:MAG: AAA family ATPase, partial [Actinomycetota bacterium]